MQDTSDMGREAALAELAELLGPKGFLRDPADLDRHATDASGARFGLPLAVLRPVDTAECAAAVTICARAGLAMVPQGGRTGLSAGACPPEGAVVISTLRIGGIRVDPGAMTVTAGAGVALQQVQEAALSLGLCYPVDIGARGSATIGGTVATNAGGVRVLRHGMTRRHVLGLEAVLPEGRVVSRMNGLLKDNAGYDLSQLFIGSEGTLGIITRVLLQLRPDEPANALTLLAFPDHAAALDCLAQARRRFGERLSAFEGMWPDYWEAVCHRWGLVTSPFQANHGFYALMELTGPDADAVAGLEDWLGDRMEEGLILDGTIARSGEEERRLWAIRHAVGEVDAAMGPHISFDLSTAPGDLDRFCDALDGLLQRCSAATGWFKVGHIGDGNVHLLVAHDGSAAAIHRIEEVVYTHTGHAGGSVTAEHGIGRLKREWVSACRSEVSLTMCRSLRGAIDPSGLMNPGAL